ncbi:MAG: WYL domain-containing protein [Oscillospiraceae bacterium]|nr:WYL domain-containing protein [Oscillospiraceae bacterium]
MAGRADQKLKTLYILRCLEQNTDAEHGVGVAELIAYLQNNGISAERKSIYSDIELLRSFGMDIEAVRGKTTQYRLLSRKFQLPELKLLVDVVGASRFITRKKSLELIEKLESLTSVYEARALRRSVFVDKRVKSMNESIYYSVDTIHTAVAQDKKLSFRYFSYNREKQRELRRGGAAYVVSPAALTYADENYYLYAYDDTRGEMRIYRVDRMVSTTLLDTPREHNAVIDEFDPAAYSERMFSMYGGEMTRVTLRFDAALATVAVDRFGADAALVPDGDGFTVTTDVVASPNFYGWVFGFGGGVRILSPANVRGAYLSMARRALDAEGAEG